MSKEKMSLFMKIMIGVIPVLLCGLICMLLFVTKNKEKTAQQSPNLLLADSKLEKAPQSKSEAYKMDKEKQEENQRVAQESKIMSNNAFYDVENDQKSSNNQKTLATAPVIENKQEFQGKQSKTCPINSGKKVQPTGTHSVPAQRKANNIQTPSDDNELSDIDKLVKQQKAAGIKNSTQTSKREVQESAPIEKESNQKVSANPTGRSRNLDITSKPHSDNMISAVINSDQVITSGAKVKLRLTESIDVDGVTISRNSFVTGTATFTKTRISITIQSIIVGKSLLAFNKVVYDKDGMEGINLPDNTKSENASEGGADMVNGALNNVTTSMGIVGTAINSTKNIIRKTTQRQTVSLKANYKIFLK